MRFSYRLVGISVKMVVYDRRTVERSARCERSSNRELVKLSFAHAFYFETWLLIVVLLMYKLDLSTFN